MRKETRKERNRVLVGILALITGAWLFISSCTNEKGSASNIFLDNAHRDNLSCSQSGCHTGFGPAGTVFADFNGQTVQPGVQINMVRLPGNEVITLPLSDALGNFYTTQTISGNFQMFAGPVGQVRGSTSIHIFPDWNSCNRCHVPGGSSFDAFPAPTGTMKWRP